MTFDSKRPFKNVDGKNINLTDAEIAEIQVDEAKAEELRPIITAQKQIAALEAQQTAALVRAAILGDKPALSALQSIDDQVAALGSQLATASGKISDIEKK